MSTLAGKLVAFHERLHSVNNALGICGFLTIWHLERWINAQYANLGRQDDYPPDRFFLSRVQRGPYAGVGLEREAFEGMLLENYAVHQWGTDGIPTCRNLDEHGLTEFHT